VLTLAVIVVYETGLVQKFVKYLSGQKLRAQNRFRLELPAVYIVVVFFFSWLPYIVITRSTYIYHFYLSVPLLCLATTYFINKYWNTRLGKAAAIALFVSVVILFIVFYPVISGMPAPVTYIHKLKWLPGWFFAP
jgi:dolichyl-phosphate-mannose--protein O-mannosyl transferase